MFKKFFGIVKVGLGKVLNGLLLIFNLESLLCLDLLLRVLEGWWLVDNLFCEFLVIVKFLINDVIWWVKCVE